MGTTVIINHDDYLLKALFSSQCKIGATGDYHEIKH